MSSVDGEDDVIAQPSTAADHPSPKRARYDSSSDEDDDYYSNFDKMLERNKKATQKVIPKYDTVKEKAPSPRLISSSDSESDIEEIKEENTLATLMKKGKKFNEDREKKINADIDRIREMADVREAEEGALPDMVYRDPHVREAEHRLKRLREDRKTANERRSLDTGYVDCVVIDGYGQRLEKEYGSYGTHNNIRKGPEVTFLLQDLYKNDTKIEKMEYGAPMRSFVERITKRWNCREIEVVLTLEGGVSITDLDISPRELNVSLDGIHPISAVFVPSKKAVLQEPAPRDPNFILIKFQSGQGKPAMIEMNKTSPFSDILSKVAEGLKMETVGRLVFDCEKVDLSCTPVDLDMDDEDCMDVYPS